MKFDYRNTLLTFSIALASTTTAHLDKPIEENPRSQFNEKIPDEFKGSWQDWHMKVEHNLDSADPASVFILHDTTHTGNLYRDDILRMYGLKKDEVVGSGDGMGLHDNSELIGSELQDTIVKKIMELMDTDNDGIVQLDEWLAYSANGGEFPDFGIGSGHEYDFEEEYEKHHWLEHHAENDPDVLVQHAEDIEHELLHHLHEIEHEDLHAEEGVNKKVYNRRVDIKFDNIPLKFRAQ